MVVHPTRRNLLQLQQEIITCRRCPRLVAWRERLAREKTKRFADEEYWGKPVPSFGDWRACLLIIGLAPAAHGGNRTGRTFTGDRSGDWLYRALYKAGFANQPVSLHRHDGLKLKDCLITAPCRCAPPANKPTPEELANCRPFILTEAALLKQIKVVIALGRIAFNTALSVFGEVYGMTHSPRPKFAHRAEVKLTDKITLLASFHPSQQNTFTGRLTEAMFDAVFRRARQLLDSDRGRRQPC
ncbi:MAG: uracil-DNA glycosylase [candidate division KSB1 bacterium]|nr:uracil-DNA glycosylase [candidate division KSB1 bacterium]MDZ7273576.1 uracil-DNA glycosylase [candidate division KSB1 bacterium]MDZ7286833.1 uracil-DNA glycosylase [candidate division KSB1 bacterium]MDZ7299810.1 uracil-DNA glycosylase [candidate division KSB1 bacterium]MDZ7309437.1 uracil-DNA glycosylase [candidate division KSB1 bacterium]